jgi:hypothetical protein
MRLPWDPVFYDTTSLHFEIDDADEGPSRGLMKIRSEFVK